MGDGVWPLIRALLPRAVRLQVRSISMLVKPCISERGPSHSAHAWQVDSQGGVAVAVGGEGAIRLPTLSGGKGLGPNGAQRLAELLREAPPPMLAALDLRHLAAPLAPCQS